MNKINVREIYDHSYDAYQEHEIRFTKWNAEKAFNRLTISREVLKLLTNGINENADSMPLNTRKLYNEIIKLIKKAEAFEIETIRNGE